MKISTILRKAANDHLWMGTSDGWRKRGADDVNKSFFCCDAVDQARDTIKYQSWSAYYADEERIRNFLQSLGQGIGFSEFKEFDNDELARQEIRYTWLMFAADIAEEEGN